MTAAKGWHERVLREGGVVGLVAVEADREREERGMAHGFGGDATDARLAVSLARKVICNWWVFQLSLSPRFR